MIDPERIESINNIVLPHNKREMQSCLGNINFVHRFICNFDKIVKAM